MTYKERIPSQREKIIKALKDAGAEGVTNTELVRICLRYGARLQELYKMGYLITHEAIKDENGENGVYKYVLLKEPSTIEYHNNAAEEIFFEIRNFYEDGITSGELKMLLEYKFFYIIRKPNWYKNRLQKI